MAGKIGLDPLRPTPAARRSALDRERGHQPCLSPFTPFNSSRNKKTRAIDIHQGIKAYPLNGYPAPTADWFIEQDGIRYPTLERLIEIKLASHLWGHRAHDLADVVRLIQHHKLDKAFADKIHPALKTKFAEAVETAGLERDIE